jgi:hypothetical protein
MGVITGDPKWLAAVDGAWDMLRASWLHVGGSVAINEAQLYPPGSYFLEPPNPDWQHPTPTPTGELCGSSFWIKLNQRLQRLRPDVEAYAAEIERSLLNVVLAAISGDGLGIRYFARLHQHKDGASNVSTCCEGQGTRELGALPEYIFSTSTRGVHVHLFQAATLNTTFAGSLLTVSMATDFPYGSDVAISIAGAAPPLAAPVALLLRVPAWAALPVVNISVTDVAGRQTFVAGARGTYAEIVLAPGSLPATVALALPAAVRSTLYEGYDQIGNSSRYALEWGPVLLAAAGPLTSVSAKDAAVVLPASLDPSRPADWLVPVPGVPLHFTIAAGAAPGVTYLPYFEVQGESFDVFPVFGGGFTPMPCTLASLQAYLVPPVARAGRDANITAELADAPAGCADAASLSGALTLPPGLSLPPGGEAPVAARRGDGVLTLTWSGVVAAAAVTGAQARFSASAPGVTPLADAAFAVSFLPPLPGPAPPSHSRYAPAPSPPDTGAVVGAMFVCGLWRGRSAWAPLLPFRDREPALSFYDDGDPAVVDWELSWALDAGVKLFLPVWFREKGNAGRAVVPAFAHWLHRGFFGARYAPLAKFAIVWDNVNSCCDGLDAGNATADLLDNVVPFWLSTYWLRSEAYLVDGTRPLVVIYDPDLFISSLGGPAATAAALAGAEDLARAAGFAGVHWAAQWCYGNTSDPHAAWPGSGFSTTFAYHWPTFTDLAGGVPGGRFPSAAAMAALEPECSERQDAGTLPNVPTLTAGWDDLPWNPAPGNSNRLWRLDSPGYGAAAAAAAALLAARRAQGATGLHATHLAVDNLNEWAEGHFVGPHRELGFARLDAIRAALAPGAPPMQWLLPEDVGLAWDAYTTCFSGVNATPCENS